jgi:hypothetical protein
MTPEQKKFLRARFKKASGEQPDIKHLKQLLLRLGGDYIVAPPAADPDIPALLDRGFTMHGPPKMKRMRSSMCHQNVSTVWQSKVPKLIAVGTGYALSEDGLWRQHSWGVLRDGLLETTVVRVKYFGLLLQAADADSFAARNSS